MKRFWMIAVVVGIGVFWFTGRDAYIYCTNRQPTRLSCQEFLSNRPKARWVELTDCQVDYLNAVKLEDAVKKSDAGTFVPVRPPNSTGQASILVKMKTTDVQKRITAMTDPMAPTPPKETARTLKGMIDTADDKTSRAIQKTGVAAADFVVLAEGQAPSLVGVACISAFLIVAGVGSALMFVMKRAPKAEATTAAPTSESPGQPPSA